MKTRIRSWPVLLAGVVSIGLGVALVLAIGGGPAGVDPDREPAQLPSAVFPIDRPAEQNAGLERAAERSAAARAIAERGLPGANAALARAAREASIPGAVAWAHPSKPPPALDGQTFPRPAGAAATFIVPLSGDSGVEHAYAAWAISVVAGAARRLAPAGTFAVPMHVEAIGVLPDGSETDVLVVVGDRQDPARRPPSPVAVEARVRSRAQRLGIEVLEVSFIEADGLGVAIDVSSPNPAETFGSYSLTLYELLGESAAGLAGGIFFSVRDAGTGGLVGYSFFTSDSSSGTYSNPDYFETPIR